MKINNTFEELIDIANNVLSEYNIKPENIKVIQNEGLKSLWKFSNNGKTLCLKRLRHSIEKATFSVNAQIHIFNNGGKVPKVYLNEKGEAITQYREQLFVLYQWIDGRDLNFTRATDFNKGIEGLAVFHAISKGYVAPKDARISSKLGRWPDQYKSMMNRMIRWKEEAKKNPSNPSYKTYLECMDNIISLCQKAIEELQASSYESLTSIQKHESSLCHQDYGSGNAILSDKGIYVIDLDGVTYDLSARDLRKIIGKRAEKRGRWEIEDINRILGYYEKLNKLLPEEIEILKIDLLFPHWFFGTIKTMFSKNKMVKTSEIIKIANLEQEKVEVLNNWKNN